MNRISSAATKSLTVRYTVAFIAIVTTCLASQLVIQTLLSNAQTHAQVVNVAGRQRMLSQRIAKVCHQLVANPHPLDLQDLLGELNSSVRDFRHMDQAIRSGDESMGIPALASGNSLVQLNQVHPDLETITTSADEIAKLASAGASNSPEARRLAESIDDAESQFLVGMEQVVASIVDHSRSQINRLVWADRLITFATLLMLFLEAIFVFRPAVRRVSDSIQGLRVALAQARSASEGAQLAIVDRNVALSAAALDLKRLSTEIDALLLEHVSNKAPRDGNRFRMLIAHVHNILGKLTDLAGGSDNADEQLVVSRTSPRILVKDAVQNFNRKTGDEVEVNVTMDVRLPASMLVDEQLLRESIIQLLQSVSDSVGTSLAVHVGYDDRDLQLMINIAADSQNSSLDIASQLPARVSLANINDAMAVRMESESLNLLLAKRTIERLGGTIRSSDQCDRITIRLPLDENKRMTLFVDNDRFQNA